MASTASEPRGLFVLFLDKKNKKSSHLCDASFVALPHAAKRGGTTGFLSFALLRSLLGMRFSKI
ncbi:hypothetical protein [uncultured Mucilaginibacter sp.]|uniref:hypothetical protein n=1 Tax=uncultured Mucilaginibacter sp. TaxID=797541 RepID=UPI0025EB9FB3|nr:hypothetical protein [uncultured Mucilaginibacter sp.]